MPFELDHVFIGTGVGAPEADALVEFGLREGEPNTHPGQGTANRRFFFENMMLELFWVDNERDAKSPLAAGLHVWERWKGRRGEASPFGVCLRPADVATQTMPFAGWAYRPPYFAPRFIHVGENSASIHEPLICFQSLPATPPHFVQPAGFQRVTELRIFSPFAAEKSEVMADVTRTGTMKYCVGETHLMEIGFHGETNGRTKDLRPQLPLKLCW